MLTFLSWIRNRRGDFKLWQRPKRSKRWNAPLYWWKWDMTTAAPWTRLSLTSSWRRMNRKMLKLDCPSHKNSQVKCKSLEWSSSRIQEGKRKTLSFMEKLQLCKMPKILTKPSSHSVSILCSSRLKLSRLCKISEWSATTFPAWTCLISSWRSDLFWRSSSQNSNPTSIRSCITWRAHGLNS